MNVFSMSHQHGLSLVELAIALAAMGVMTWAVANAYGNTARQRDHDAALVQGQQMLDAIRAFALANSRLPCPDTDGDGWEGNASGACPSSVEVGWLPYRSLGYDLPDARFRAAYGVYRNASATAGNADLAVLAERSNPLDVPGDSGYKNVRDLIAALGFAAAESASTTHIRLTGDGAQRGAIDCTNNIHHPAFAMVLPLNDMDGDGSRFDGIHAGLPMTGNCFQAPGSPMKNTQDDVVIDDSFSALAGWLSARAP